ncbi:unnamed protein product [Adineta ricciae]|uniref:Uncharacterized protein n=1 Tax=Adineta ricciae TaxID=249248 RepID=A0A816A9T3_ADIRI|nr:unnamed protein product [Adineta ricciae]
MCILFALYVVFDLQFGTHNRTIQLLYGILLQEPGSLSKPLRLLLTQWNFVIEKRQKRDSHLLGVSANEEIMRKTAENFAQDDDEQAAHLRDGEKQGRDQLGAGNSQSLITVSVQMDEADLIKEYPPDCSPSSPTDSSFVVCHLPIVNE